jgi:predicted Zn finger-like uncharacterized protein
MQVTCPNCGARYAVDPLAIGPVGRIVQCARCSNRWLQTVAAAKAKADAAREPEEAAPAAPEPTPGSAFSASPPAAEPAPDSLSKPPPGGFSLGPARIVTPPATAEPFEAIPDLVIRPPRERTSLPAVIKTRPGRRLPFVTIVIVLLLVAIGGAAAAAYVHRDVLLPMIPELLSMIPEEWRKILHLTP